MPARFEWRHQYDGSEDALTFSTARIYDHSRDRAIQSEKDSADINTLVKRFGVTNIPGRVPSFYGDFSDVGDYQTALERVRIAQERFFELPSTVRDRFSNDPQRLLEFVRDPENRAEAVEIGLLEPPPAPSAPIDVRVVQPPEPSGEG